MAKDLEGMTPAELKAQADAILASADAEAAVEDVEIPAARHKRSNKKKAAEVQEPPHVMTDEEAKKAGILRLDDKQVAALPAASWLINQEKLPFFCKLVAFYLFISVRLSPLNFLWF